MALGNIKFPSQAIIFLWCRVQKPSAHGRSFRETYIMSKSTVMDKIQLSNLAQELLDIGVTCVRLLPFPLTLFRRDRSSNHRKWLRLSQIVAIKRQRMFKTTSRLQNLLAKMVPCHFADRQLTEWSNWASSIAKTQDKLLSLRLADGLTFSQITVGRPTFGQMTRNQ